MTYPISELIKLGSGDTAYYTETVDGVKYEYFCESAQPGKSLEEKVRRIRRIGTDVASGDPETGKFLVWANGSSDYDKVATDLATIKSEYTFS